MISSHSETATAGNTPVVEMIEISKRFQLEGVVARHLLRPFAPAKETR